MATLQSLLEYGIDFSNNSYGSGRWDIFISPDMLNYRMNVVYADRSVIKIDNYYAPGTQTWVVGDVYTDQGGIHWNSLSSLELRGANGALLSAISDVSSIACPSGGLGTVFDVGQLLLSGNDTASGSGSRDWLEGSVGNDTLYASAGGDYMAGGVGDDTYVIRAGDFGAGDIINSGKGASIGTDTIKLQDAGDVDLRHTGQVGIDEKYVRGVSRLDFDTGTSTAIIDGDNFGSAQPGTVTYGDHWINQVDGSAQSDALDIQNVDGSFDYTNVHFTNWSISDKIVYHFAPESLRVSQPVYGTAQSDGFIFDTPYGAKVYGNGGNDTFDYVVGGVVGAISGGAGQDWADIYGVDITFQGARDLDVEGLVFTAVDGRTASLKVYGNLADNFTVDYRYLPKIEGSSNSESLEFEGRTINLTGLVVTNWSDHDDAIRLIGIGANDRLTGSGYRDVLVGVTANSTDVLDGKGGADTMTGGGGNDIYYVDNGGDSVVESALPSGGADTVYASTSWTMGTGQGIETLAANAGNSGLVLTGNDLGQTLYGGAGIDTLNGLGSDDRLNGGAGADTMNGGTGNDIFYVDNVGDSVVESALASGGTDTVYASTSWSMASGQGIETLIANAGNSGLGLTGNELGQTLYGGAGVDTLNGLDANDRLDGKGGADTMDGGTGNDIFYVDNAGDSVVESALASGGTDTVYASTSWSMASGQGIETLIANAGNSGLTLTGNELGQMLYGAGGVDTLNGLGGNDRLDGKAGADTMDGGTGNDIFYVDNSGDSVVESALASAGTDTVYASTSWSMAAGQGIETLSTTSTTSSGAINLTGNELAQKLNGNADANLLDGKAGNDVLQGYLGNDTFVFSTPPSTANVDQIVDFTTVAGNDDTIRLEHTIFSGMGSNVALAATFFSANASGTAQDGDDHIIYNTTTGKLFYDSDGTGANASVQFAILSNHAALTAADFFIA